MQAGRLALLALALSASTLGAQMRVVVKLRGFETAVMLDTLGVQKEIGAPVDKVYQASLAVFEAIGIPVNTKDPRRGIVAATRFAKVHVLAGNQLAQYFSCGTGMTGPHANEWRLEIAVAALVDPGGPGNTKLRLATVASGQDVEGSSKDPLPCYSTGNLEATLLKMITVKSAEP
jgi:hypothetical protein